MHQVPPGCCQGVKRNVLSAHMASGDLTESYANLVKFADMANRNQGAKNAEVGISVTTVR